MKPKLTSQLLSYKGVLSRLEANIEDEILYTFKFNLDRDNNYIRGACAIAGGKLFICSGENSDVVELDIKTLEDTEYIQYVGCAAIEYRHDGESIELCRSSMENALLMQTAVNKIKALYNGRNISVGDEDDMVCPKCGLPYRAGTKVCPFCTDKKRMFKEIMQFVKPYRIQLLIGVVFCLLMIAGNVILPIVERSLVNNYLNAVNADIGKYVLMVFAMAGVTLFITLVRIIRNNVFVRIGTKITVDIRQALYLKVQSMSISGIGRKTAGELITRITRDSMEIKEFLVSTFLNIVYLGTLFIGILVMMLVFSWKLTLMILLPVVPLFFMFSFIRSFTHRMYHKQWKSESEVDTLLHDVLSGIRVVKVFGTEKYETERFSKASRKVADVSQRNERRWNMIMPTAGFILRIGEFVVLAYVGGQILKGTMGFGDLTMFISYVSMLYGPLDWATFIPRQLVRAMTSMSKIVELLDEEPEITDAEDAIADEIEGNIQFRNATFGYNNYEDVLKCLNLDINKGEMVGVVGRSGVGKSTLINLVLRLYDLTDGELLIDGRNIKSYNQQSLRAQTGVVLQETYLFKGTIFSNIAYAKPECEPEEVIKAARIANAHQFIMKQPDAYNTFVGERGMTLSGGERQRIAIARTILRNPTVLILDEATASLDTETEKLIQDAINRLVSGRTTIAIAHRLSTLRNATKLAVLEKGELEEVGTHDELMRSKGRYYKLVMAQRQMSKLKK